MTDEQLLAAINSVQTNLKAEMSNLRAEVSAMKEDLLQHIHGVGAQLHIQLQEVVDRMDARLDRHGGLLQGGSRAITRMVEWTESADTTLSRYDRRLAEFERRLEQIEKR